jgi:hypothetical protein
LLCRRGDVCQSVQPFGRRGGMPQRRRGPHPIQATTQRGPQNITLTAEMAVQRPYPGDIPHAFWISAVEVAAYPRLAKSAGAVSSSRSRLEVSAVCRRLTVLDCNPTSK